MPKSLEQVYAESQQAYDNAQIIPRSMPPDGQYTVAISRVAEMVSKKDESLSVIVIGQVVDGDFEGKEFVLQRYNAKYPDFFKAFVDLVIGESGTLADDVKAVKEAADNNVLLSVEVVRKVADNGREYANANVLGTVG